MADERQYSGTLHAGEGNLQEMRATGEYRGIAYSIPHNDNGVWHYQVHPKRDKLLAMRGRPQPTAATGYPSRDAAVAAAQKAIDAWLERPSG